MGDDFSGLATIVYDCRPPADQVQAVDHCIAHCRSILLSSARSMIARYHLVDPAFDGDDAVQSAALESLQVVAGGKLAAVETDEQMLKLALHKLRDVARHEARRELAQKRWGSGASRAALERTFDGSDRGSEAVDRRAAQPDQRAIADDELERVLKRLDARDRSLRAVAAAMAQELTQQEIAARLGLSTGAVDHKVRLVRTILGARDTKHG
jgi:DNA-directed RNA polymerase specialized sigma24 family protein